MAKLDIEFGREILMSNEIEAPNRFSMEMQLQSASYGHSYTLLELAMTDDYVTQTELAEKLDEYKASYYRAREFLNNHNPKRLIELERELTDTKLSQSYSNIIN